MKKQNEEGKNAIELLEEAFQLLRSAPLPAHAAYYAGALPFVLAFLYFWSDMSGGVLAEQRLAPGVTILVGLFIWMKCWQAVFARRLLAHLRGQRELRWTRSQIAHVIAAQTIIQPSGLFLIPLSAITLVPLPWVFAFYQNAVVLGSGEEADVKSVLRVSSRQMKLWFAQNYCGLLVLKLFGIFVWVNIVTGMLTAPYLLKGLLGIETAFSRSWMAALNTTFFATSFAMAYLCIDPLIKAVYVVRCFHGRSLESAEDLRVELRARARPSRLAIASACVFMGFTLSCGAAEPARGAAERAAVTTPALERSISEVIRQREYTWRISREKAPAPEVKSGWLQRILNSFTEWLKGVVEKVFSWLRKVVQWIFQNRRANAGGGGLNVDWYAALKALLIVLCIALLVFVGMLLFRSWRRRQTAPEVAAQPIQPMPDLRDENTGADELPEDGWLQMARELLASGELRLALRAYYLASLAHLAERNLITIARYKSNRDYERELNRRAHTLPTVVGLFSENVSIFDRVWYGLHDVTDELLNAFASNVTRIKTS